VEVVTQAPRVRRQRSATESLLSIALALEAFLVFFVALTAFALDALEPVAAFVGGGLFVLLLVVCARMVRSRAGLVLGWVLQAALLATGILIPVMFLVAAVFVALYTYCFFKGRSLDLARASHTDSE
jgi:hypothetical protein